MPFRSSTVLICFLCLLISLISNSASAQDIKPTNDRLDAIVSRPLIIPITVNDERALRKKLITKLDDGRTLESVAYWVGITPNTQQQSWTRSGGIWTANQYQSIANIPPSERPIGRWFIRIPLPIDSVGQGLWFGTERYELNWLSDPERTLLEAQTPELRDQLQAFWDSNLDQHILNDPAIQYALAQYEHNPFEFWRSQLLLHGLNPAHHADLSANLSLQELALELQMNAPGAEFLRDLASQGVARWQIILGRIWLIDPTVAQRLKSTLMQTAQFWNRTLPIWNEDVGDLDKLTQDLLSPFVDDETRVLRAKAWLEIQPRSLAWVIDDQGNIEADTHRFLPTIGVISLPPTPGQSVFRLDSPSLSETSTQLNTIDGFVLNTMSAAVTPIHTSRTTPHLQSQPLRIRTGRWSIDCPVIVSPTPAQAPFIRIGPLLNDWTMSSLIKNQTNQLAIPQQASRTLGILRKTTSPSRTNQTQGWQLYIEMRSLNPSSPNEQLSLHVGPSLSPKAVWHITPVAQLTNFTINDSNMALPNVRTKVLDDRWIAVIDLPAGAFDQDELLQLGIERTNSMGHHSAWPRRMIPGQSAPGRLSIEGNRYDGFTEN